MVTRYQVEKIRSQGSKNLSQGSTTMFGQHYDIREIRYQRSEDVHLKRGYKILSNFVWQLETQHS